MELVYEGEQMGAYDVALSLINESILNQVAPNFPPIQSGTKMKTVNPYQQISDWFSKGNHIAIGMEDSEALYQKVITSIPETKSFLKTIDKKDHNLGIECILHIISGANIIQKEWLDQRITFKDQLASMLSDLDLSSN